MTTRFTAAILTTAIALCAAAPGRGQECSGDCDGNGIVAVNEIVVGINILLTNGAVTACTAIDANRNGVVTVNELVAAVNNLQCDCMTCPTPLPTRTPSQTPTPSFTATEIPATPTAAPEVGSVLFLEGWGRARLGTYRPRADLPIGGDVIAGDTGDWLVIDTVTNFEDCGESPHSAEIVNEDGSRRLRVNSGNSHSECADNIDVGAITRNPPANRGVAVDLAEDIFLSFRETGALTAGKDCDAVYLVVEFDQVDRLSYVLQRGPAWEGSVDNCTSLLIHPNALLLDPNRVEHTRNLLADAEEAGFQRPSRITFIGFSVDSEGSATFDDIRVFRARGGDGPTPTRTATPTRTPTPRPCECLRVQQGPWCLEGDGGSLDGRLTQSGCTITFGDQSVRGPICGDLWTVHNERAGLDLECRFQGGNPATECWGSLSAPQGSGSIHMHVGRCD